MAAAIVKAVDVGYGNTKYTVLASEKGITCGIFPSIAPQAAGGPDLDSGLMQRRNTVVVDVGGVKYEVGKDAMLAVDSTHGRVLDTDYCMSDAHLALLRGALYYMGAPKIDLLVLGLPVNNHKVYSQELAKKIIGTHPVPFRSGEKECVIENVIVLPQPIGAFFDYSIHTGQYEKMRAQKNLLIDIGFYTVDWVVSNGAKMERNRSDATNGGMSAVIQTMAKSIGDAIGEQITNLTLIEEALRTGTNPLFYGKEYDISEHIKVGKKKAEQFISTVVNNVGNGIDITNIILAGGGADFFQDVIQDKFPKHNIIIATDAVFANVRGFLRAGTTMVDQFKKSKG